MEAGLEEEFYCDTGYSTSQYAVSHFADLLDNIESVSDNDIVYINKLPVEDGNFVEFEIKICRGTYILKQLGGIVKMNSEKFTGIGLVPLF